MSAPTLFDAPIEPPLPVRHNDPETSRVAAKSLHLKARKREVLDAMSLLGSSCTADQILEVLQRCGVRSDRSKVCSRLNQLRVDGLVAKRGVREGGTGRPVTTWGLVS